VNLNGRLERLERRGRGEGYTEAELRATADAVAREHDLPVEEVLAEMERWLARTPAEQAAFIAALPPDLRAEIEAILESGG
jgi:enamine deaminase RidA (YjgF/YER057c/UK114 family)